MATTTRTAAEVAAEYAHHFLFSRRWGVIADADYPQLIVYSNQGNDLNALVLETFLDYALANRWEVDSSGWCSDRYSWAVVIDLYDRNINDVRRALDDAFETVYSRRAGVKL